MCNNMKINVAKCSASGIAISYKRPQRQTNTEYLKTWEHVRIFQWMAGDFTSVSKHRLSPSLEADMPNLTHVQSTGAFQPAQKLYRAFPTPVHAHGVFIHIIAEL